jgi:broad specificity phosphatase PhoE
MLVLLRHGESGANAAGELVGRRDPSLTELGSRQAEAAARLLASELGAEPRGQLRVVSSPLRRARATAEMVAFALGAEVQVEEALIEIDYGSLEGLKPAEVDRETWATWRRQPSWRPPGGESLEEVQARVATWCEQVATEAGSGTVVAVSHVSPIKAAAIWAMGLGPEVVWRLSLGVASITRVSTAPSSLCSFGERAHLVGVT